jgi:ketosteroid isomerase-like protein
VARSNVEVVTTSFQHFVESGEMQGIGSRVLVLGRMKARGASGVAVERDDGIVYELREGQIVRLDYFNDQSLARTAIDAASA